MPHPTRCAAGCNRPPDFRGLCAPCLWRLWREEKTRADRADPPRGPCGMPRHARDCDCDGAGGRR